MKFFFRKSDNWDDQQQSFHNFQGIEQPDTNLALIAVKGTVEETTEILQKSCGFDIVYRDYYAQEIQVKAALALVFRLRGQEWTLIYQPRLNKFSTLLPREQTLQTLSSKMATEVIYVMLSDTCGASEYNYFSNGEQLEYFSSVSGSPRKFKFKSKISSISLREVKAQVPVFFLDKFLQRKKFYCPDLAFHNTMKIDQKILLIFEDFTLQDFTLTESHFHGFNCLMKTI